LATNQRERLPFSVGERLGGGTFADVYEVVGRSAVVKIARSEARDDPQATGAVFGARGVSFVTGSQVPWNVQPAVVVEREQAVLKGISHKAFPKVLEVGKEGNPPRSWFTMEHIPGTTWRQALSSQVPPGLKEFRKLVLALAEVSDSGQLRWHGDLKPENLMLTPMRDVVVLDPASGCVELGPNKQPQSLLATAWYNPAFETNDFFSLGLILVEILTGEHLLLAASSRDEDATRSLGATLQEWLSVARVTGRGSPLLRRIASMKLPRELNPSLSQAIEDLALKCMSLVRRGDSLDRIDTFRSPRELAEAIAKIL
jgi:serine/threonine protein kinase